VDKLREAGIVPVNISAYPPRFVKAPYLRYLKLAPRRDMLKMEASEYNVEFAKILKNLVVTDVVEELAKLTGYGKPIALCCFEKSDETCHRKLVANWLRANGYEVREWQPAAVPDLFKQ